ncbi:ATP-binding cassette sub-family G member 1 [Agrilus planipennis]|uniref:ATP-binding cassette sub-family G member 1 n=1 Tax=Agrilus planipennis TaxID=224129 RepID=A0A1W4WIE5_AGRPL|nr:ATP-binding cassette sub-family G member 1 [Agrilus planipennis]
MNCELIMEEGSLLRVKKRALTHLPRRLPVNIDFQELTFSVPQGRKGPKVILRSISGQFKSGHLNAILGPSGSGKSTLLNILAGYKYLLGNYFLIIFQVTEILDMLRLTSSKDTPTERLSGGERKRLAIALELVNNPPVIFLDEPTTGLDDLSSSQCITLLKYLAEGGRTVICSLHTPSARLFAMFDHVYIVSDGLCAYQGTGTNILPFLDNIGLSCPTHYNPADFIIEVCSGEYGNFSDKMINLIENGRSVSYCKTTTCDELPEYENEEIGNSNCIYAPTTKPKRQHECSPWLQFKILLYRFWIQTWRDSDMLILKTVLYIVIGLLVGNFYLQMGNDGSKTIFNFGFCFTCIIFFLYIPMMPVLLKFPTQLQLLKREYFNRWYGLTAYFLALTVSTLSLQLIFGFLYVLIVYPLTAQPLEFFRILMFLTVCTLTGFISESLGLLISSTLNVINGMFVGPCISAPLILLSVYGLGQGTNIPFLIRLAMYFSYLRYALEGLILAVYGYNREKLPCPEEEIFCQYRDAKPFMAIMGMENAMFWVDILVLLFFFIFFRVVSLYLLRQRLRPNKTFAALQLVGRIIKSHFSMAR